LADDVLNKFKRQVESLTLIPSDKGRFEFSIDGELLFSKLETRRFPTNDEIIGIIQKRLSVKR
jgi:selenoprotein W-related protein